MQYNIINPSIGECYSNQFVCVCVSVCHLVILENASFRFLLNPLLERTRVLLTNNCGDFWKALLISYHLEISWLSNLCFYCHIEFFFGYVWSFAQKFKSFEDLILKIGHPAYALTLTSTKLKISFDICFTIIIHPLSYILYTMHSLFLYSFFILFFHNITQNKFKI